MASIRKPSTQPAPLPSATHDEYTAWIATADPGDCSVNDPIQSVIGMVWYELVLVWYIPPRPGMV
jgi:hypothetical protein